MKKTGMSLIEVIVVVVIISILATLAMAQYGTYRETSLDREAQANLRLMIAAQRIYRMEAGNYYPVAGAEQNNVTLINDNLKLFLTTTNWNYLTKSTLPAAACAKATRVGGDGRTWRFDNDDPNPVAGGSCP